MWRNNRCLKKKIELFVKCIVWGKWKIIYIRGTYSKCWSLKVQDVWKSVCENWSGSYGGSYWFVFSSPMGGEGLISYETFSWRNNASDESYYLCLCLSFWSLCETDNCSGLLWFYFFRYVSVSVMYHRDAPSIFKRVLKNYGLLIVDVAHSIINHYGTS